MATWRNDFSSLLHQFSTTLITWIPIKNYKRYSVSTYFALAWHITLAGNGRLYFSEHFEDFNISFKCSKRRQNRIKHSAFLRCCFNRFTLKVKEGVWNETDSVKYGNYPDQSQSFRFFARLSHCCKLRKAPKQTTSSLDRFGCELIPELFIRTVRVLCKSYSYKWFLSRLT